MQGKVAKHTINAWKSLPWLEPKDTLPALMQYVESSKNERAVRTSLSSLALCVHTRHLAQIERAVNYLHACVRAGNTDPIVHNYLVTLYVRSQVSPSWIGKLHGLVVDQLCLVQTMEPKLIEYIQSWDNTDPDTDSIPYDMKLALLIARKHKKLRACVELYKYARAPDSLLPSFCSVGGCACTTTL